LVFALAFAACFLAIGRRPAAAWGDERHEIIALVAERLLVILPCGKRLQRR
jgi:hypothetical protein